MTARTREQRETGIIWDEATDSAVLWTLSEPMKRRMTQRLGPPMVSGPCAEWTFPKSWVRLPSKPRVLSEAAKAAAVLRLEQSRK